MTPVAAERMAGVLLFAYDRGAVLVVADERVEVVVFVDEGVEEFEGVACCMSLLGLKP